MGEHYSHLSAQDRVEIEKGLERGESLRQIARRVGRSVSTVSREVGRNSWRASNENASYQPYRGQGYRFRGLSGLRYLAMRAESRARERTARCHARRKLVADAQVAWVCARIKEDGWTPEQVAGHSKVAFPDDASMWVSCETVYAWAHDPGQAHHRIPEYLPRAHRRRRKRGGRRVRSSGIDRRVGFRNRPASVEGRVEFGHWEGDTVEGPRPASVGVHTEVERKTRYLKAALVPAVDSVSTIRAQVGMFEPLPQPARQTVTLDNGHEHHLHWMLVEALGVLTYFADPYSSFQRGTNEHFNGVLRRWFPKGTRFEDVTPEELAWAVDKTNNRPLECLGWRTPAQAFQNELDKLNSQPHTTCCTPN
jgi:IS30 family transposase